MDESFSKRGRKQLEEGDFEQAGNNFTQASYQSLAHDSIAKANDHQIGAGLELMLRAALAYQRGGHTVRCRNRCEQGILITKDLQEHVVSDDKRKAVLQEYIADFHGIGRLEGTDQAYQEALDWLEEAELEYTISFHSSQISDTIIEFTLYLIQFVETKPDNELEIPYDFAGRVTYKRDVIDELY